MYLPLIDLWKCVKTMHWKNDSLFNESCWENWISTHRKMKADPHLLPRTKINSKWIKILNVIPESLKVLEENIRDMFQGIGMVKDFLVQLPKAQETKGKTDKMDFIKLKRF